MRRRDKERGAILPIILGGMMLLVTLAYGGFTIMRVVVARQEAQRAADAAVLVAANSVKHEGLPFDAVKQGKAQAVAGVNSNHNLTYEWTLNETPDQVNILCQVSSDVSAPGFIFPEGRIRVTANAVGIAKQRTITEVEKKYPKLVLVLDFSGSMLRPLGDDGTNYLAQSDERTSYQVLRRAVNMLLDHNYDIKYGLVIYASQVLDSIAIALGNIAAVRTSVNTSRHCPSAEGGCSTATWDALADAVELFERAEGDEGQFVLLVSDGQPNNDPQVSVTQGIQRSIAQVERLWNLGATIYTIHLVNTNRDVQSLRDFMMGISGPPDKRGDPEYYFDAASDDKLNDLFASIGAAIACQIGPISPPPPDPKRMHVFVRAENGEETALIDSTRAEGLDPAEKPGHLWDLQRPFHDGPYYFYKEDTATLYVTPPICTRVLTHHHPVLVRWVPPALTE